jgi:hypothetical protein
MKQAGDTNLLAGAAPVFLEARKMECGAGVRTLLEYRGHPLIAEATHGRGRVLVVASDVFSNDFMCLPGVLRRMPFKPGNQQLAKNLVQHLLSGLLPKVQTMEIGHSEARMHICGRGGEIRFRTSWTDVLVQVNGKNVTSETGNALAIRAPQGETRVELRAK